jgi:hypothetical protein
LNNILLTKINTLFLSVILIAGTITLSFPSFMLGTAQAQSYYEMDNDRKQDVSISSLKCNNINVNVNGLELSVLPPFLSDGEIAAETVEPNTDASSFAGGNNGYGPQINDFRFICINNNNNTVIEEGPTIASLTVKKQVFGCDNITGGPDFTMDCDFQNNSEEWLDCNNSAISDTIFCQSLPESIFDIEVLDDQNAQIQQFEGSEQGTIIQNLEPGTYTVNEIKVDGNLNQLGIVQEVEDACVNLSGFSDGGDLFNTTSNVFYRFICFEYEDEQGNDCSTITLAAGEERTCTVKNYIRLAENSIL